MSADCPKKARGKNPGRERFMARSTKCTKPMLLIKNVRRFGMSCFIRWSTISASKTSPFQSTMTAVAESWACAAGAFPSFPPPMSRERVQLFSGDLPSSGALAWPLRISAAPTADSRIMGCSPMD